jgi:outer membrane protein assembly factor BamE (lipoprotein component of BamABCDE complex)
MKKYRFLLTVTAAACLIATGGCTPMRSVRGNMLKDYQLAEVKPGIDTQSDVLRKLGSPTTKAPFDDNIWYYLGQETEKRGILDPEVTKERIVAVTFDAQGVAAKIEDVPPDRNDIPYVREKTPTSGNEMTVMQQLLGNMGRFNKDSTGERSVPGT